LHDYDAGWLDTLCLSGQVAWCRLSPRRRSEGTIKNGEDSGQDGAQVADSPVNGADESKRRSAPTKAAPLAIMLRKDLAWLRAPAGRAGDDPTLRKESERKRAPERPYDDRPEGGDACDGLSAAAGSVYEHLQRRGASFLAEIASATGHQPAEVEDGLWELVSAGLATADGFASMRVLVDRHRGESRSVWDLDRRTNEPSRSRKWRDAVSKARRRERYRPAHAVRSLPTAAGRCRFWVRPMATPWTARPRPGSSWRGTGWCFAICWRASPICRRGVSC
jgi:ATP-dependent Lhr-like helicase